MDPITGLMIVNGVVTLAAQWMASSAAADIDKKRQEEVAQALAVFEKNYKFPDLDPTPITQEQYRLLQQYVPKVADYVQMKMPQIITEADSGAAKQAQSDALKEFASLSKTGTSAIFDAEKAQGEFDALSARKRQTQDTLKQYVNQGLSGGNQELLASVANNQASESSMRNSNLAAAANAETARTSALKNYADLGSNIRRDNFNTENANVSTINRFNEMNTRSQNDYNQNTANTMNDASKYNIGEAQRISDNNTNVRNTNMVNARARADMIEKAKRDAQNDFQTSMLNSRTGQAATNRSDGQAGIGRDLAMANTVIGTGVAAAKQQYTPKGPTEDQKYQDWLKTKKG